MTSLASAIIRDAGLPSDYRAALELALAAWARDPDVRAACKRVREEREVDKRKGRPVVWTAERIVEVERLRAEGWSWAQVGARYEISADGAFNGASLARRRANAEGATE